MKRLLPINVIPVLEMNSGGSKNILLTVTFGLKTSRKLDGGRILKEFKNLLGHRDERCPGTDLNECRARSL